jgi:hypothetical protein
VLGQAEQVARLGPGGAEAVQLVGTEPEQRLRGGRPARREHQPVVQHDGDPGGNLLAEDVQRHRREIAAHGALADAESERVRLAQLPDEARQHRVGGGQGGVGPGGHQSGKPAPCSASGRGPKMRHHWPAASCDSYWKRTAMRLP